MNSGVAGNQTHNAVAPVAPATVSYSPTMSGSARYRKLSAHLREVFGCRVQRVAVDAGFTCPNRGGFAGSGGCIYCDQAGSRAAYVEPELPVREQVRRGVEHMRRRYKARKFLVYFQPYTNTYGPIDRLRALYDEALDHPDVVGLMIGTRADCADEDVLDLLLDYHRKTYLWLELGLQSTSAITRKRIDREENIHVFKFAARRAKARGLRLCAHLIVGFPTDTPTDHFNAAEMLNLLRFDGVKIHSLYISRNARLSHLYKPASFPLMTRDEYVERVCDVLERLDPRIVIHRLTSDADEQTLVAPDWVLDKRGVIADIEAELKRRDSRQGERQT